MFDIALSLYFDNCHVFFGLPRIIEVKPNSSKISKVWLNDKTDVSNNLTSLEIKTLKLRLI